MPLILGPDHSAIAAMRQICATGEVARITVLVAWARLTGIALFFDALGADVSEVRIAVGMAGAGTSPEALSYLRAHCAEVHLFHKHHRQTFHPKVYCFDGPGSPPVSSTLVVGSSNLTGGGLLSNFEASLVSVLAPADSGPDHEIWASVMAAFDSVVLSPFCEQIVDDARIQVLLDEGYLSLESRLRQRGAKEEAAAAKASARRGMPEAPPPKIPSLPLPPLPFAFVDPAALAAPPGPLTPPPAFAGHEPHLPIAFDSFVADGRFFVRTLTPNDVAKALGQQVGTFEPDLGVTARDELPAFWGWPERFVAVTRGQTRDEWAARARAFSSTMPAGINIEFMQWFRAARPATATDPRPHAAEHRFRIGPKASFRAALPPGFGVTSLVVIERMPDSFGYDFRIRIVVQGDPEYADYSRYLTKTRPGHRFGYGPDDPEE